jgi:hypothetical protein
MLLMFKTLLFPSRHGLLLWLGVCLVPPASAAAPAVLQPLLLPSYAYWIEDECVEEPAPARPLLAAAAGTAPTPAPTTRPVVAAVASGAPTPAPVARPVVSPPSPPPAPPPSSWQLRASDQTVKTALMRWAAAESWQLVWEAPVDYAVERDTTVGGTFEQAIEAVAQSMAGAETPLQAIFYKGNRVIRIVVKGAPT